MSQTVSAGLEAPPAALRDHSRGKKLFLAGLLLLLLLFPLLILTGRVGGMNYYLHMMLFTFMYIAMASSWNMIGGYTGYTSLGHNVFFAVGGYLSGVLFVYFKISPFITAPLAGLLAMAFGFLVGLISLRTRGPAFIISTIAMLLLVKISLDNWGYVGGVGGLSLPFLRIPLQWSKVPFYYGMLIVAVGAIYLSYRIRHSKFGLGLRAISQDETKAEVAGIPTNYYKILAFAFSGLFVGMAGALWGYYLTYLRPSIFLTILVAAQLVLMTVLGGKGTVAGPVVGAILFIVINEFFVAQFGSSELNIVITGAVLALTLLLFPAGIVGTLKARGRLPALLDWE
jgi:branched-chain amino acid transport system permease protein